LKHDDGLLKRFRAGRTARDVNVYWNKLVRAVHYAVRVME